LPIIDLNTKIIEVQMLLKAMHRGEVPHKRRGWDLGRKLAEKDGDGRRLGKGFALCHHPPLTFTKKSNLVASPLA
jgi:hypothetical protein